MHPVFLALALVASAHGAAKKASVTLCRSDEVAIFNCKAAKKWISICASAGWTSAQGYLQYRFGLPGKIDAEVPKDKSIAPKQIATYHQMAYSGGGGAAVRFTGEEGFEYVVYSGIGKGWEKAGVQVERNGKYVSNVRCKDGGDVDLPALEKAALKKAPEDFEIPE